MKKLLKTSLTWHSIVLGLFLGVGLVGSGCSVALKSGQLNPPLQARSGQIRVADRAEGIDGRVGWGRATVFYVPLVPVHITGDGNQQVMARVIEALQEVGYQVIPADTDGLAQGGPVLKAGVNKFFFNNYTWFFPLVPTWGNIQLTARLVSPTGTTLWSRDFSGGGSSFNFFNGYTSAANKAMKKILNDMVREFSGEEFHRILTQK